MHKLVYQRLKRGIGFIEWYPMYSMVWVTSCQEIPKNFKKNEKLQWNFHPFHSRHYMEFDWKYWSPWWKIVIFKIFKIWIFVVYFTFSIENGGTVAKWPKMQRNTKIDTIFKNFTDFKILTFTWISTKFLIPHDGNRPWNFLIFWSYPKFLLSPCRTSVDR